MNGPQPVNGKQISGRISRLRQLAHNLGRSREGYSSGPTEDVITKEIGDIAEEICTLIKDDPAFSQDYYFVSLPDDYKKMAMGVRNSYEVNDLLIRDEVVFQLNLGSLSGFKHWLSMRPHEFKAAVEFLLKSQTSR